MRKNLITVLTLVLVAVLAVPALGAELNVSGKYVGEIEYDETVVNSINAGGETPGIDLLGMSTLYLTLDFAEGETVEGHIPLRLYNYDGFVVDADPDDSFWAVYRGYPFIISLSNQTKGDYAFSSLGDPLGLGDRIVALDDEYAVLKIAGQPYDVDTNAYVIYTKEQIGEKATEGIVDDEDYEFSDKDIRYVLGRATYDLADGYTLGLTAGVKHLAKYDYECYNKEKENNRESKLVDCGLDSTEDNLALNLGFDVTGPLPVSDEATFTAALALGKNRAVEDGESRSLLKALELNLNDMAFEGITFNADMHLIDEGFAAVAPDTRADSESDIVAYNGNLHLYGEALTTFNLLDMDFDLKAYDEFLINADTKKDEDSYNEIGANVEFQPMDPLTVDVGGYFNSCLDEKEHADDFDTQVYGKGTYVFNDMLELWGRGTWGMGKLYNDDTAVLDEGYGFRLDGGFDATPLEGVTVSGEAAYQFKDYDFEDAVPLKEANRLDASLYAVAEQTFVPEMVEKVDVVAAALVKGDDIGADDAETTLVGYGYADIAINDQFSDEVALLVGSGDHYSVALHNKLTYNISDNSALGVGCTYREDKLAVDADYTVKIGDSTLEVGYGKSALAAKECTGADDKGKPWAWLCNASTADTKPYLFTLKITVPF